jgi:hypothetical protein
MKEINIKDHTLNYIVVNGLGDVPTHTNFYSGVKISKTFYGVQKITPKYLFNIMIDIDNNALSKKEIKNMVFEKYQEYTKKYRNK